LDKSPYLVVAIIYVGKKRIQNPIKQPTIILTSILFKKLFPSFNKGY
jgi:hypothetical protein